MQYCEITQNQCFLFSVEFTFAIVFGAFPLLEGILEYTSIAYVHEIDHIRPKHFSQRKKKNSKKQNPRMHRVS